MELSQVCNEKQIPEIYAFEYYLNPDETTSMVS
jgi:hypothetical protein